jgi:hypothetical protein
MNAWRTNPGIHRSQIPSRLPDIADRDGSRFGAPPYTLPALSPDFNTSPCINRNYTTSYPSSSVTPNYDLRQYFLPSLTNPSPSVSYQSLHPNSSDGDDSSRSMSPTDTYLPNYSIGVPPAHDANQGIRRPHVASSAIRDASVARRSRDARFFCNVPGCGSNFTTKSNFQGPSLFCS